MFDLVCIGNPVYDQIITPYIRTEGRVLSGCSTNTCLAARKLGVSKVGFVGCIGKDCEAHFRQWMDKYGIDAQGTKVVSSTGGFKLVYDDRGDRTLDVLGVSEEIHPEDIPDELLESEVILFGPILGEIGVETIRYVRNHSKAEIFLDPQGLIREIGDGGRIVEHGDPQVTRTLCGLVDIIKPNEHEAKLMVDHENPFAVSRLLVDWGARLSIVTLAEKGSVISKEHGQVRIFAYETIARDPTGAGDTYAGAFISKYLAGGDVYHCGLFASAAASIKVENTGPDFTLDPNEVIRRMNVLAGS
jgi:sugar/nucleoside kinase (ribokinase family)